MMVWRIVAPPPVPSWVLPWAGASTEHVAAHDCCADVVKRLPQDIVIRPCFSVIGVTVKCAKGFQFEEPIVEMLSAFTEWILEALLRPGDVSVERHRDIESQFAHDSSRER